MSGHCYASWNVEISLIIHLNNIPVYYIVQMSVVRSAHKLDRYSVYLQVLSRSGSVEQQRHFIDLLELNVAVDSCNDDGVVRGSERNCVKLRGLPWSSSAEDVIKFFGELGSDIAPQGVHMVLNAMVRLLAPSFLSRFCSIAGTCCFVLLPCGLEGAVVCNLCV